MSYQDWNVVGWDKRGEKKAGETKKAQVNRAMRSGTGVTTEKKVGPVNAAGSSGASAMVASARKLEEEEDTFIHEKVSLAMSKRIAQARCEKKLTQKDLAALLSLPAKIIQEYESGKAIPNHVVINKLEKALGAKLRDGKSESKK